MSWADIEDVSGSPDHACSQGIKIHVVEHGQIIMMMVMMVNNADLSDRGNIRALQSRSMMTVRTRW